MLNDIYQAFDPVAFWVGPFAVRWYGLGYIAGILFGGILLMRICKRWKIHLTVDTLLTIYTGAALGIILGARVGYILFYGAGYYFEHPADILGFSGMSFHGGVIGMAIAMFIVARICKIPFGSLADLIAIVAPIGIFLVRCANFINGELWGAPTDLPWGVEFETGGGIARHPTQLYEAMLEGAVLFVVMMILARRKPPLPRGSYLGVFFVLYGVFRIAIEFVRQPDVQLGYLAGDWLTMGMVLCLPMLAIGAALLVYAVKIKQPQEGLFEPDISELDELDETPSDNEPDEVPDKDTEEELPEEDAGDKMIEGAEKDETPSDDENDSECKE